jgi:adenosylcobinamide-phosphate synthase
MHILAFTFAIAAISTAIEAFLGYPDRMFAKIGHPVTWMGRMISALDRRLNRDDLPVQSRYLAGLVTLLCLILITGLLVQGLVYVVAYLLGPGPLALLILGVCTSPCLAQRSLAQHVGDVARALDSGGIEAGRAALSHIVGRDVAQLDRSGVCRAAIESLAENFSDGIIAPAFWIALCGPIGGFVYKAINTADSMIGHRTKRYAAFGFFAAKLDDGVNFIPARLAALWLCLSAGRIGAVARAFPIAMRDSHGHPSPNAGWPEAAMAGAIDVRLGGPRIYAERKVEDRWIGDGKSELAPADIWHALRIYRRACLLNFAVLAALAVLFIALG